MKQRSTKQTSKARPANVPRPRVYLDSTIPSVYFDERDSIRFEIENTRRWWREESQNYEIWVSPATLAEVEDGDYPRQQEVVDFCDELPLLPPSPTVDALADLYIQNLVMPRKHLGDAWHLAYATFHGFDFLLTWNCNHLANVNKRRHLENVNKGAGYLTSQIVTPLELFRESENL